MKKLFYIFVLSFIFSASNIFAQYWAKSVGGSSFDSGFSIAIDDRGNVYLTGVFSGTVDFDPSNSTQNLTSIGDLDIFVSKYDANGNYIYAKSFGGTKYDFSYSIAVDRSGNVYLTGFFQETVDFDPSNGAQNITSAGSADIFFAKFDSSGNYIYAKNLGGTSDDRGKSITVDGSGNVYLTGFFNGTADFDPSMSIQILTSAGFYEIYFAKYDANGNYIYAKSLGGIEYESGTAIAVDRSGNVFLTGYFSGTADFDPSNAIQTLTYSGGDGFNIFFAMYDSYGSYVYAKNLGGSNDDRGEAIKVDESGSVYLTGSFYGTADFDPSGLAKNLISAGWADIFFAKYDASGNYIYAKNIGGIKSDYGISLSVDVFGYVYLTGYFNGTVDFDPGSEVHNLTSIDDDEIFFAKYDLNGNYVYAKKLGGNGNDNGKSIVFDGSGNIYLTGYFQGIADFDPGSSTQNLISLGHLDIFFAKYNSSGTLITKLKDKNEIPLQFELLQNYPNPFNPTTTIRFGLPKEANVKLEIYNPIGQLIETLIDEELTAHYYEVKWETGRIPSGLYFYKLTAIDNNNSNNKFVKTMKMMLMK